MRQWYPLYQTIKGIREEYPQKNYRKPKDFIKTIPGMDLYNKYQNYLTDKKTGYRYIDFANEIESAKTERKHHSLFNPILPLMLLPLIITLTPRFPHPLP